MRIRDEEIKGATSYESCLRQCVECQVGYSNSKEEPTLIYKDYALNVPEELRKDLEHTLNNAINLKNRENKRWKFGYSTSEDALSWSFFKYFTINDRLKDLLKLLEINGIGSDVEIYLWGVNITKKIVNDKFHQNFITVSKDFRENPRSMTEPDVVIKSHNRLVFIEIKYNSSNSISTDYQKFKKYEVSDIDLNSIVESGYYELLRNWAFAQKLSNGGNFTLINLGREKLFKDKTQQLRQFEDSLKSKNGKFERLSWESVIHKIHSHKEEYNDWFINYLNEKFKFLSPESN